ncbi:hypothetical protein YC2023_023334 [Brassica napus]
MEGISEQVSRSDAPCRRKHETHRAFSISGHVVRQCPKGYSSYSDRDGLSKGKRRCWFYDNMAQLWWPRTYGLRVPICSAR